MTQHYTQISDIWTLLMCGCVMSTECIEYLIFSMGRFRGLREVQVVCVQTGGAQSTSTC